MDDRIRRKGKTEPRKTTKRERASERASRVEWSVDSERQGGSSRREGSAYGYKEKVVVCACVCIHIKREETERERERRGMCVRNFGESAIRSKKDSVKKECTSRVSLNAALSNFMLPPGEMSNRKPKSI